MSNNSYTHQAVNSSEDNRNNTFGHIRESAPSCAFVTAAGLGTRLRPYTLDTPKPLVAVKGRPILDYILDDLEKAQVKTVVINTHYKAEKIEDFFATQSRPDMEFILIHEEELLDTGGGIRQGLPYFKGAPFYAVSSDSLWTNSHTDALTRMAQSWDSKKMDLLLLLQPTNNMHSEDTVGDYDFTTAPPLSPIIRSKSGKGSHMWTSVRICTPSLFDNTPAAQPFSFLQMMDKAEAAGRLYGIEHDAQWFHISTKGDLENLNKDNGETKLFCQMT